jgi:hypothetical protein
MGGETLIHRLGNRTVLEDIYKRSVANVFQERMPYANAHCLYNRYRLDSPSLGIVGATRVGS